LCEAITPLLCLVQLPLQHHNQFDQPIDTDPPIANIVLELLNVQAPSKIDFPKSRSGNFTEWTT